VSGNEGINFAGMSRPEASGSRAQPAARLLPEISIYVPAETTKDANLQAK
jgi:hypothetical protein